MTFVKDRTGHDLRYAINSTKIVSELGRSPRYTFETGIRLRVKWNLENQTWIHRKIHSK